MACSGTKLERAAPAQHFYQGVMWQSLRANAPGGELPHLVVLSALHGFLSGSEVVEPYDKLLTPARSRELEFDLAQFVSSVAWPQDVTRILVAGGGLYRYLMRRMVGELIRAGKLGTNLNISEVSGGIGLQRSQLGQFVRDPASLPVSHAGYHPNGTPLLKEAWGFAVGDRVRTTGRYVGKAGPKLARIEELFMGPSGPTASVEFEDDRPPLASGRARSEWPSPGAWVGVSMLAKVPGQPSESEPDLQAIDPENAWERIPGLSALDEAASDEGTESLLSVEQPEREAPGLRMQ